MGWAVPCARVRLTRILLNSGLRARAETPASHMCQREAAKYRKGKGRRPRLEDLETARSQHSSQRIVIVVVVSC